MPSPFIQVIRCLAALLGLALAVALADVPQQVLAQPLEQAVGMDPRHEWREIVTTHFRVVYPAAEETLARESARLAERHYATLHKMLGWEPAERIRLVLATDYEASNGFAVPFPYNQIQIFPAAPRPGNLLDDHGGQWLSLLILHELTHIMHLDQVRQLPRALRLTFGRAPVFGTWSVMAPVWLVEGLPTWTESAGTGEGRIGATLSEALVRNAAAGGAFPAMGRGTVYPVPYPDGHIPYVFGGYFFDWLIERHGLVSARAWVHDYSRGPVPYSPDWSAEQVFGAPFRKLWEEWQRVLETRAARQVAELESRGLREGVQVYPTDGKPQGFVFDAGFTPEGKVTLVATPEDDPPGYFFLDPTTGEIDELDDELAATDYTFARREGELIAAGIRARRPDVFSRIDQVVSGPWPNGELQPFEPAAHGREPAIAPGGRTLVFVHRNGPSTYLARADLTKPDEQAIPLTSPDEGFDYADPVFLNDEELVVSVRGPQPERRLFRIDASTGARLGELTPGTTGKQIQPSLSPDGTLLTYADDRTGIFNLYVLELASGTERMLTNVTGAALNPSVSPEGRRVAFISWEPTGHAVRVIDLPVDWKDTLPAPDGYRLAPIAERPTNLAVLLKDYPPAIESEIEIGFTVPASEKPGWPTPRGDASGIEAPMPKANDRAAPPEEQTDNVGETKREELPGDTPESPTHPGMGTPWEEQPYRPWLTLLPRFWSPNWIRANNDDLFGVFTGSQDVLRHWFYTLSAYYGTNSGEPRVYATAGYSRLPIEAIQSPIVFASYSRDLRSFGRAALFTGSGTQVVDVWQLSNAFRVGFSSQTIFEVSAAPLAEDVTEGLFYSIGYQFERREDLDGNLVALAAQSGVNPEPFTGTSLSGLFGLVGLNAVEFSPLAFSPESGVRVLGEVDFYHNAFGSDLDTALVSAGARLYQEMPWLEHHVLALRVAGGTTFGDRPLTRAYILGGSLGEGFTTLRTTRLTLLRGYAESRFAGDHFVVGNAEYRLPLWMPHSAWWNFPIFLETLALVAFADAGQAWDKGEDPKTDRIAVGTGAEIWLDTVLGYFVQLNVRVGYGRGLTVIESNQYYLQIGSTF